LNNSKLLEYINIIFKHQVSLSFETIDSNNLKTFRNFDVLNFEDYLTHSFIDLSIQDFVSKNISFTDFVNYFYKNKIETIDGKTVSYPIHNGTVIKMQYTENSYVACLILTDKSFFLKSPSVCTYSIQSSDPLKQDFQIIVNKIDGTKTNY
jgi:hypothetical protein